MFFNLVSRAVAIASLVLISTSDVVSSFKMEPKYLKDSIVSRLLLFTVCSCQCLCFLALT